MQYAFEMVTWTVVFTKQAQKDARKLAQSHLKNKAQHLLDVITQNPFAENPPYEKLLGDLTGTYSRRINLQHRLVYEVFETKKIIKVIRMWTHYDKV